MATLTRAGVVAGAGVALIYGLLSTPQLIERWGTSAAGVVVFAAWSLAAAWALSTALQQRTRGVHWPLFGAVAVGLRVVMAMIVATRQVSGDADLYVVLAHHVLAGRGLVVFEPYMGVETRALYPPLYALLLAGWGGLFGFGTAALTALSTLLDLACAAAIAGLGRLLGEWRAGAAAAALYLIWPSVILSAPVAQKESLSALLIVLMACAWVRAIARPGWAIGGALGGLAAALALVQPGQAPLAALFGLMLLPWLGLRRLMATAIVAVPCAVLAMLPWWVRNTLVFGGFVPLTSASGYSLWVGNNPGATGNWMAPPPHLSGLHEIAFGHAAGAIARAWISSHPFEFVRLTAAKLLRSTGIAEAGLVRLAAMRPPVAAAIEAALLLTSQGAHLLMLGGTVVAASLRRDRALGIATALVAAGLLQLVLFGVWFEFAERHREFLTPLMLLAGSVAWSRVAARLPQTNRQAANSSS